MMLIDLLNSSNYIMVNKDAINILGLNTAVYCSELLNIYKKANIKNKLIDDKYFKIDRAYIEKQTSISVDEQVKCDLNLIKVNIISRSEDDPDTIFFDVEVYASILSSEDVKLLDKVSQKVKIKNPKGVNAVARDRIIYNLKNSIQCKTPEVLFALKGWIDAIMADPKNFLSTAQISIFKNTIDDYCNGNLQLALELIKIATVHAYKDCQWAINTYEKDKQIQQSISKTTLGASRQPILRTEQKISKVENLSEEVF